MRNNHGETARDLALRFNKMATVEVIDKALKDSGSSREDLVELRGDSGLFLSLVHLQSNNKYMCLLLSSSGNGCSWLS